MRIFAVGLSARGDGGQAIDVIDGVAAHAEHVPGSCGLDISGQYRMRVCGLSFVLLADAPAICGSARRRRAARTGAAAAAAHLPGRHRSRARRRHRHAARRRAGHRSAGRRLRGHRRRRAADRRDDQVRAGRRHADRRTSTSRSRFARRSTPLLEAAREDVRLFAIFLDDYHIDKRPDITLPLRDALTKFVNQLGPNDLVALMEPLTTLYDLKYTRSKDDLLSRIRTFEGRRGEAFPVKSAIEEAQLTQRNWHGAARRRHAVGAQGAGHADGRPARRPQVDPVLQPGPAAAARAARTNQRYARSDGSGQSRQRHHSRDRSAAARRGRLRRRQHAAAASPPTPAAAPSSTPTIRPSSSTA